MNIQITGHIEEREFTTDDMQQTKESLTVRKPRDRWHYPKKFFGSGSKIPQYSLPPWITCALKMEYFPKNMQNGNNNSDNQIWEGKQSRTIKI